MDIDSAVIIGVTLIPIFGTVLGWHREHLWLRTLYEGTNPCPTCKHPEHWPWCTQCGCDLFTEPED